MLNFTQRQLEIIHVSMKIIADLGMAELSIKNIASQIGIKESSIYNHFESKKAILKGIFDYYQHYILEDLNLVVETEGTYLDKVKAFYDALFNDLEQKPVFTKLLLREFYNYDPYYRDDYISLLITFESGIMSIINEAKAKGEVKDWLDADFVVATLLGLAKFLTKNNYSLPDYDLKANKERYWHIVEQMISTS